MAGTPPARLPFGRGMRLKQSRDFARLKRQGRRLACGCFIANWQTLPPGAAMRLGVVTARRLWQRPGSRAQRARRLLRETFRLHQHDFAQPLDLVLVAQKPIVEPRHGGRGGRVSRHVAQDRPVQNRMNAAQHLIIFGVRVYQWTFSPLKNVLFGPMGGCRFEPSCSVCGLEAVRSHGAGRGGWLALRRICRCHPLRGRLRA